MSDVTFEAPSVESLGELLPAYAVEAFVAKGGMGAVYKARQRSLDRDVAIKILPREFGSDPEFIASFETEAKAMARLNHPNLIAVYDYGEVLGMPYIVMEFVPGKSLFHSAYHLKVDPPQAVTIVKGICDGLAHAHENGVIHRDIKPANILLTPRAVPKIGDFGLARPADADGEGLVMGTPGYVAREVLQFPERADRRSDLFALGVVLYELLIGKSPPYESTPPPSTLCGCDVGLDRICAKAMNPLAELRYQSAEEMVADLDAWLRNPHAAAAAMPPQPPAGPRHRVPSTTDMAPASSSSSSSGAVKGLVMLAAAIVVGALGWSKFSAGKEETQKTAQQPKADPTPPASSPANHAAPTTAPDDPVPAKPESAPVADSPLASLAKLKAALANGERETMPVGAVDLGSSHVMVIPEPMSWSAASAFAAEHGAYLLVVDSPAVLEKIAPLLPPAKGDEEAGIWLGAGSAGKDAWSWVDGTPWSEDLKPQGGGSYLILDRNGALKARENGDRYPFAIQWRKDGENPAAFPLMLQRTGESLTAGAPVYPPGTLVSPWGEVLIMPAAVSYTRAAGFAEAAHGRLMSPATREQDEWLAARLPSGGSGGYWLGASRKDGTWGWDDGTAWQYTRWVGSGQPPVSGDKLMMVPGQGWVAEFPDTLAAGFVIVWPAAGSAGPPPSGDPAPVAEVPLPPALAELEAKAKELLENLAKERDKGLAANAKTFAWDLDNWLKDLSKNEMASWKPHVERLKQSVRNNRVPSKVEARMSAQMTKVARYCSEKQDAIDADFESKAGKVRDSYVTRMNAAAASAEPGLAAAIKRRVKLTVDLEKWISGYGVKGKEEVVIGMNLRIISANYGSGGKNADVTEKVRQLLVKEHRAFHVTPPDLGTDPNPYWNKSLTVKYEVNGVAGEKSWGENSKVEPRDFISGK